MPNKSIATVPAASCSLCLLPGGELLWEDEFARVVLADEPDYPGFCRVILQAHCQEMTDLTVRDRHRLMAIVFTVESLLRELLQPDKVNLASLGNQVPHLHWHVIPRFAGDPHFPDSVWSARRSEQVTALPADFVNSMRRRLAEPIRDPGPAPDQG